ncbi:MAG: PIG-L family deacetylase [Actinobacteria bacterium]|nr:MAG: PIG-L family deacetylase [Actinomycetota bacterium]
MRRPARALAVGAHPDDVEFGCGGTLAKWAGDGTTIMHVVCTDGSKGSWDPDEPVAELVATRQDEQRAAARALGGSGDDVVFLGYTDGELQAGIDERRELVRWIRRLQPDVVLGHDPWRRYRLHPDHRQAGFLVTDAIVAARDPHFFPDLGPAPHRPSALLLWEADEPNHTEDITASLERKLRALLAHRSQFRSTHHIDDPADEAQVERFRARVAARAAEHAVDAHRADARVELGERFRIITEL